MQLPHFSTRRAIGLALLAFGLAGAIWAGIRSFSPVPGADACEAAVRDALLLPAGATGRAAVVSRACAPLFLEPACRAAHEGFDRPAPSARAATLARTCREAYCPRLAAPRPPLCDDDPGALAPAELAKEWSEFVPVVLRHDHGARAAHVIETLRAPR